MKWKNKLTKKQRAHLSEMGIRYKWQLIEQKELMLKLRQTNMQPCYDCIDILRRLEMWED